MPLEELPRTRFASFCRYLHFDERGTGCSDRSGRIADLGAHLSVQSPGSAGSCAAG